MASVNVVPMINKLNANNYTTWKRDIKFVLYEKNAWNIVVGSEVSPDVEKAEKQALADFENRSRIALTTLYMYVSPEYRGLIENCLTPVDAWKALGDHFQPDSKARHMALFSELLSCFILPNEGIGLYSARLVRINEQLKDINHEVPEIYLSFQLLRYLPDKFDHVVQNILRWSDENFKFKDITMELVAEETRLKLRDSDRKHNGKIVEVQNTFSSNKFKLQNVTCFRCGNKGHFKRNCKVKLPRYRTNSSSSSVSSNESNHFSQTRKSNQKFRNLTNKNSKSNYPSQHNNATSFYIAETSYNSFSQENSWVFDTAASHHFCRDVEMFSTYTPVTGEQMHVAVDNMTFPIHGKGEVVMTFKNGTYTFKDVLYSPELRKNLISGPKMDVNGAKFKGENGKIKVVDKNGTTVFKAKLIGGSYYVFPRIRKNSKNVNFEVSSVESSNLELWHKRFAHISSDLLIKTGKRNCVVGMPSLKSDNYFCEPCQLGKKRRVSFKPLGFIQSKTPLERVYTDVWGPISVQGRNGERFFLSIIDDFSRKVVVYPFQDKSQVFGIFTRHIARAERFLNKKLKFIRSDNGTEFDNDQFKSYCDQTGIQHEFTNTYTPEQNGPCERFNQTALNHVRSILSESGMPWKFWPDAVIYFSYSWNRVCHKDQAVTPFELYSGRKPSVRHLKCFGATAYVGIPKYKRRTKLDLKARKGIMIGYGLKTKGYRIWFEEDDKVIETINVNFKEGESFRSSLSREPLLDLETGEGEEYGVVESQPSEIPTSSIPNLESDENKITQDPQISTDQSQTLSQLPRHVNWVREPVPRRTGTRVDIYYYEEGQPMKRLRSLNNVMDYCNKNNIVYEPTLFNFSGSNLEKGIVKTVSDSAASTPSTSLLKNS